MEVCRHMCAMHIEAWGCCWEPSLFALPPFSLREGLSFKCWYGYSPLTLGSAPPPVSVFKQATIPAWHSSGFWGSKVWSFLLYANAVATDWGVFLTWRGSSKGWANLHVYFFVYLCFTSPLFYVALFSWERSCQPWSKWSYDWGLVDWRENSWTGEIAQTWNCKGNLSL